jgi:DNA repair protein RadC
VNAHIHQQELLTPDLAGLRYGGEVRVQLVQLGEREPAEDGASPKELALYWKRRVAKTAWYDGEREMAVVFCLDVKNAITAFALVGIGTLNEVVVHPRDVFRPAIAAGAYRIVFMHNHPSGDVAPSKGDQKMTVQLSECGSLLGITLIDHIIIGSRTRGRAQWFSFREYGAL